LSGHEAIERSVQTDIRRQETHKMRETIAEYLVKKGHKEGRKKGIEVGREEGERKAALQVRRETLSRLLRQRFGDIPAEAEAVIQETEDPRRLDEWVDRVLTARTFAQMGIV
jgi:hypothetical protein